MPLSDSCQGGDEWGCSPAEVVGAYPFQMRRSCRCTARVLPSLAARMRESTVVCLDEIAETTIYAKVLLWRKLQSLAERASRRPVRR